MTIVIAIGIATGCVYALVGIGFSLIYRTTGIVNFAQGVFVALGGMSAYWLTSVREWPYALALVAAVGLSALAGLALWLLVVLPLWRRGAEQVSVLMATLVAGALATALLQKWLGSQPRTLPEWISGLKLKLPGGSITGQYALVVIATVVLVVVLAAFLRWSTLGRSMRACAASRETAALLGISPERIGALAMMLSAALGGLAGILIAPAQYTATDATVYGIFGFVAAVLGGFGTLIGPVIGGIVVGLVQAFVGRYGNVEYETLTVFALLLVLMTFRPQGILGSQWSDH
jgi:branched-chain amino acid transport system permease protein